MVAAPLLVLPAALLLIASTIGRPLYIDRYVLYGEIGAALLAGAGLVRIGRALASRGGGRAELAWAPGLIACLAAVLLQLGVQNFIRTPQSRQFDFGGPASYVGTHAQPGDAVLFFDSFYRRARMGYPQDFRHVADIALAVTPARVGNFRGTNKPFSRLQPIMLAHRRIWVIGTSPFSTRPRGPSITEQAALLRTRFVLTTTRRFRGIVVTLWRQR
jgi:mannosyltransferase